MNQVNAMDLLRLFDFDLRTFLSGKHPTCQEDLNVLTAEAKAEIKVRFHALALQHHPDKAGDAERFKELSNAYKLIQDNLRLVVQRPQQPIIQIIYYSNYGGYSNQGFTSTTSATYSW